MFKKKEDVIVEDLDSLIGENIKITGKIEGKGNLRVDGFIEGDINYEGNIVVGETGKVYGNIKANDISLAGTIHGNVDSKTKLVILPTGTLIGDIQVSSFVVHENAKFDGNCKMLSNNVTELHSKSKAENTK
ncbi:polymer-forming cytoskeletal protein [Tissierella carlieri]|jgi:cytoskeletal protein CcmA (bactofilin family)|uniref:Polymer-forming cytoskeletal protein n=1 Tax=Tissierella carlieri TaxID=689904 RepID=A0ABT1SGI9_9FIRM|nr:polymer-forming cytoskeletal protein [Tissierella carlieri]MCQ4925602.1 polymer-forming cytoskeletal protein [Tissierella carlieri]